MSFKFPVSLGRPQNYTRNGKNRQQEKLPEKLQEKMGDRKL
jgi:hypothetical protein